MWKYKGSGLEPESLALCVLSPLCSFACYLLVPQSMILSYLGSGFHSSVCTVKAISTFPPQGDWGLNEMMWFYLLPRFWSLPFSPFLSSPPEPPASSPAFCTSPTRSGLHAAVWRGLCKMNLIMLFLTPVLKNLLWFPVAWGQNSPFLIVYRGQCDLTQFLGPILTPSWPILPVTFFVPVPWASLFHWMFNISSCLGNTKRLQEEQVWVGQEEPGSGTQLWPRSAFDVCWPSTWREMEWAAASLWLDSGSKVCLEV